MVKVKNQQNLRKMEKQNSLINFYYDIKEMMEEQTAAYSLEEETETAE